MRRYESTRRPIGEIADELRVGALIEGSIRYSSGQVRASAQLIDGLTSTHLCAEAYEYG